MRSVKIIGVMGISGAGKTSLVKKLSEEFNSTAIFWDEYDPISSGPEDYVQWYHASRNYNDWKYDHLSSTLQSLKQAKKLICPATQKELIPTPYIFFDAPLGRRHLSTGHWIDHLILLDTSLDVALARRLVRDFSTGEEGKEVKEMIDELVFYLQKSRPLFLIDEAEKRQCDFIVSGDSSLLEIMVKIKNNLKLNFN